MAAAVSSVDPPHVWRVDMRRLFVVVSEAKPRGLYRSIWQRPRLFCVPGRAHLLGGESPLQARQRELLAGRQGCRS